MNRRARGGRSRSRRERFAAARAPRDLGRGARVVPDWRVTAAGRARRLGPREYIGAGTTRLGRSRQLDPLATPRLWGLPEWLGFVLWAGLLGEAGRRAWKRHGGPTGGGLDAPDGDAEP